MTGDCALAAMLVLSVLQAPIAANAQPFSTPGAEKYALGGSLRAPLRLREADLKVPQVELDAQFAALSRATSISKISYHPNGVPRQVFANLPIELPHPSDQAVTEREIAPVLEGLRPILLLAGTEMFRLMHRERMASGGETLGFVQEIRGLPVFPSGLRLSSSAGSRTISALSATLLPDRYLPTEPRVAREQAEALAVDELQRTIGTAATISAHRPTELAYMLITHTMVGHLGWRVYLRTIVGPRAFTVDVDALTGAPLRVLIQDNNTAHIPTFDHVSQNGTVEPRLGDAHRSADLNAHAN